MWVFAFIVKTLLGNCYRHPHAKRIVIFFWYWNSIAMRHMNESLQNPSIYHLSYGKIEVMIHKVSQLVRQPIKLQSQNALNQTNVCHECKCSLFTQHTGFCKIFKRFEFNLVHNYWNRIKGNWCAILIIILIDGSWYTIFLWKKNNHFATDFEFTDNKFAKIMACLWGTQMRFPGITSIAIKLNRAFSAAFVAILF